MSNFDEQCQSDLTKLRSIHEEKMIIFQEKMLKDMQSKPPKWSRELIEWRKRQHILAKQENYAEAQKIKTISDALEDQEQQSINSNFSGIFKTRENNLRKQQVSEIRAMTKRLETERKEYERKRNYDCNRLEQRNKNIRTALDLKQVLLLFTNFNRIQ